MKPLRILLTLALLAGCGSARADVTPAPVCADGMVLQRESGAGLFGTAAPGEKVTVTFRGRAASATSDGKWRVEIPTGSPGGPWPLVIQGSNRLEFKKVYVGDVWLCSGQSNMVWSVRQSAGAEILSSLQPDEKMRLFQVDPRSGVSGWRAADAQSASGFSAVGFYFGRALRETKGVPVGLIQSAVGGTAIEQWMSNDTLRSLGFGVPGGPPLRQNASGLHTAMILPLQPFVVRGVLWYQGESNAGDAGNYLTLHRGLIEEWRREWDLPNLPFLFVQLARIRPAANDPVGTWPRLREAQRQTLAVPHTGMAVIFDVSDGDIHPPDKKSAGERLALIARARVYGDRLEHSGPQVRSARREGDRVVLSFSHAEGLQARGGSLRDLEIEAGGADFRLAAARIEGETVVVDVRGCNGPVRILYGWRAFPDGNLYNGAGLPASPFATAPLD